MNLSSLTNVTRPVKGRNRVGRGTSSGNGKTCGRGQKGAKARSGYKSRQTYEGGGLRLFQRMPQRGFTRGRHARPLDVITLRTIERRFADGEVVNTETLREKGIIQKHTHGVKIIGKDKLTKKIKSFDVKAYSASAREQIEKNGIAINQ